MKTVPVDYADFDENDVEIQQVGTLSVDLETCVAKFTWHDGKVWEGTFYPAESDGSEPFVEWHLEGDEYDISMDDVLDWFIKHTDWSETL